MIIGRSTATLGLAFLLFTGGAWAQPGFDEVIAIFEERCTVCHSGPSAPLGLRLDSHEQVMQGSVNGAVVLPGNPEESELVRRIEGTSQPRMPLTGPPFLDEAEIELIASWIAAGAPGGQVGDAEEPATEPARTPTDEAEQSPAAEPEGPPTYTDVEPILSSRCARCHSDGGLVGQAPEGLRLTTYELVLQGGERRVVVPFSPLASELYRKVVGHSLPRMPLDGPPYLDQEQIELIGEWIAEGARDVGGEPAPVPAGGEVRLRGTLTGRWELDGLELLVGPSARIEDEPGVGDYVEVRGVVTPDGRIRVERLRTE